MRWLLCAGLFALTATAGTADDLDTTTTSKVAELKARIARLDVVMAEKRAAARQADAVRKTIEAQFEEARRAGAANAVDLLNATRRAADEVARVAKEFFAVQRQLIRARDELDALKK